MPASPAGADPGWRRDNEVTTAPALPAAECTLPVSTNGTADPGSLPCWLASPRRSPILDCHQALLSIHALCSVERACFTDSSGPMTVDERNTIAEASMPAEKPTAVPKKSVKHAVSKQSRTLSGSGEVRAVRAALASSNPDTASMLASTPPGKSWRSCRIPREKQSPSTTLHAPSTRIDRLVRAPKRCCPASPPAPWHIGRPPNQQKSRFMPPTDVATRRTVTPVARSG
mmetsp:Transcript_27243/g.55279  ORF Transcript_27243/g.55279 Transcript_27243/m.55279 type:complete len:229 (+) Transcript_27243:92-778(+)